MPSLVLATQNRHKAGEIRAILGDAYRILTLADLPGAPALVEDAATFAGNAARKATQLAAWLADQPSALGFPLEPALVLADDSGLEVDALHGAPGVYSARFAAEERQPTESADAANNAKLLRQLQGVPPEQRTARFRCVLAVVQLEPTPGAEGACPPPAQRGAPRLFEGVCEGRIGLAPRGAAGFGYDPLFLPVGSGCSFAELGEATKNQLSHRARALARFKAWLVTRDHGS